MAEEWNNETSTVPEPRVASGREWGSRRLNISTDSGAMEKREEMLGWRLPVK